MTKFRLNSGRLDRLDTDLSKASSHTNEFPKRCVESQIASFFPDEFDDVIHHSDNNITSNETKEQEEAGTSAIGSNEEEDATDCISFKRVSHTREETHFYLAFPAKLRLKHTHFILSDSFIRSSPSLFILSVYSNSKKVCF